MKNKIHNTNKKWWEAVKEVPPERFLVINAYIIKEKKKVSNQNSFCIIRNQEKKKKIQSKEYKESNTAKRRTINMRTKLK